MKKFLMIVASILLLAGQAAAQSNTAAIVPSMRSGTTLPLTCNPNGADIWFFKNAATIGVYRCSSTNTWTLFTTGSGTSDATAANQTLEITDLDKLAARTADADTGAGTATTVMLCIAVPASGGPTCASSATPFPVDIKTISAAATGPSTAANSDAVVVAYNTLASGAVTSAMTGTTSTSVISGTASNYIYVTQCTTSNASLTVSTDILLQDGSGGTTLYVLPAPAAAVATTGGGGAVFPFPVPLKVPTSGNALFAANVTTSSSTKISCSGFKSTVSY